MAEVQPIRSSDPEKAVKPALWGRLGAAAFRKGARNLSGTVAVLLVICAAPCAPGEGRAQLMESMIR